MKKTLSIVLLAASLVSCSTSYRVKLDDGTIIGDATPGFTSVFAKDAEYKVGDSVKISASTHTINNSFANDWAVIVGVNGEQTKVEVESIVWGNETATTTETFAKGETVWMMCDPFTDTHEAIKFADKGNKTGHISYAK